MSMRPRSTLKMALLLSATVTAFSQQGTSTLAGRVMDPNNAAIPNAAVKLTNIENGATRNLVTAQDGAFRFEALFPGAYNVEVTSQGFKTFNLERIALASSETRDLGNLVMQLGTMTETVAVVAEVTPVQTASSERSQSVTPEQLQQLSLKGRDPFDMVHLIPGVVDGNIGQRDLESTYSMGSVSINGMDPQALNVSLDGITEMDEGGNYSQYVAPNMDAVQEMRVLTNGFQAEFGRQSGGAVNLVTKNGTNQFHGSGRVN